MCGQNKTKLKYLFLAWTVAADTTQLREWLERDTFWHSLSKKAVGIIHGLIGVYDNLPRDAKFYQWLELMRDTHHPFMFQGEALTRKTLKKRSLSFRFVI